MRTLNADSFSYLTSGKRLCPCENPLLCLCSVTRCFAADSCFHTAVSVKCFKVVSSLVAALNKVQWIDQPLLKRMEARISLYESKKTTAHACGRLNAVEDVDDR
jgi:hypothetical protein